MIAGESVAQTNKITKNKTMKKKNKKTKKVKKVVKLPLRVSGSLQLIPPKPAVEITRSFSYKMNVGNYESRDFFCSQKSYAKPEEAERVSEALYSFCKNEVMKSINQFRAADNKKNKDVAKDAAENDLND